MVAFLRQLRLDVATSSPSMFANDPQQLVGFLAAMIKYEFGEEKKI
jgi:hypothetical protein